LAIVAHEMGAAAESSEWEERAKQAMGREGDSPYLRLWLHVFACRAALRIGQDAVAVDAANAAREVAERSGMIEPCIVPWHSAALEAHVAADRLDGASELADWLEEVCRPLPCHAPRAVASAGHASVAWRRGDLTGAGAPISPVAGAGETAKPGLSLLKSNGSLPLPLLVSPTGISADNYFSRQKPSTIT
jgi:hypothetical protein